MNTIEVLTKARDLISNKDNWCVDVLHRRHQGRLQHCVAGAINQVCHGTAVWHYDGNGQNEKALGVLHKVCIRLFGDETIKSLFGEVTVAKHSAPAIAVNNKLGHDAIILALDTAIGDYPDHAPKEPGAKELTCVR